MAKCKYIKCDTAVTGRQVYCSDKCRKAQSRTDKSDKPELGHKLGQGITSAEVLTLDVKPMKAVIADPDFELSVTVTPDQAKFVVSGIPNFGQSNCECRHCQTNRANGNRHTINHGSYKTADQLTEREVNRWSMPGDPDYDGACLDSKYDSHRIASSTPDACASSLTKTEASQ